MLDSDHRPIVTHAFGWSPGDKPSERDVDLMIETFARPLVERQLARLGYGPVAWSEVVTDNSTDYPGRG